MNWDAKGYPEEQGIWKNSRLKQARRRAMVTLRCRIRNPAGRSLRPMWIAVEAKSSSRRSSKASFVHREAFGENRVVLEWRPRRMDRQRGLGHRLAVHRLGLTRRQLEAASLPQDPFGYGL